VRKRYEQAGREKGEEKGKKDRSKEIAKQMKKKGVGIEAIVEFTGLSKAVIGRIKTD